MINWHLGLLIDYGQTHFQADRKLLSIHKKNNYYFFYEQKNFEFIIISHEYFKYNEGTKKIFSLYSINLMALPSLACLDKTILKGAARMELPGRGILKFYSSTLSFAFLLDLD